MKFLVNEEEIYEIENVLYDYLSLIRNGVGYLSYFFEIKNHILFNSYKCVLNKHINGFYNVKFSSNNIKNKEVYEKIFNIRFAMINYQNDYEKMKKEHLYLKYKKIYNDVKIIYENNEYYIDLSDDYFNYLIYGFKSYLCIVRKNKIKIVEIFKTFYNFDESNESFNNNLNIFFSYLKKQKKHIKQTFAEQILNKIEELIK